MTVSIPLTISALGRHKAAVLAGAVLLLLAGSIATIRFLPNGIGDRLFGKDGNSAIVSAIARAPLGVDFLEMIGQRSPGARMVGDLSDTKARKLARIGRPHQRALPKIRQPAALPDEFVKPLFAPQDAVSAAPALVPTQVADVLAPQLGSVPPTLGFSPPGLGGGIIVGPGGGGVTPPTTAEPPIVITPPTIVPPAVPEPGTWAMMLIGFGAVGVALRRRRKIATLVHAI